MSEEQREQAVIAAYERLIERAQAVVAAALEDAPELDPDDGDEPCP